MSTFQSLLGSFSSVLNFDDVAVLDQAFLLGQDWLEKFTSELDWLEQLVTPFGELFDIDVASALLRDWASGDFSILPAVEVRAAESINGAYGAFSAATNTVYLSREFLNRYAETPEIIADVLFEELGHFVDAHINIADSAGDEGAIFSSLLLGVQLDATSLSALQIEDDSVVLTLDDQTIELEQATSGINPAFDLIGLTALRNDPNFAGIDGSGFSVAVIDSSVDFTHPDLQPNFRSFVNFTDAQLPGDHGTHVAGTVGARDENLGVAPDVGLIGLNVFPDGRDAGARTTDTAAALNWVLENYREHNIVAVNMSLGGGFYTSEAQALGDPRIDLIDRLESLGITVVSAGGNSYKDRESQNFGAPAIYSTLAVGAVWQDGVERNVSWRSGAIDFTTGADRVTSFSQRLNSNNSIFAPGALINSTFPGNRTGLNGGTSMASPIVAGAVALMQEAAQQFGGRLLAPAEIVEIIRSTADIIFDGDDEDDNVINTNTSYRRINVYNAVSEIRQRFQEIAPAGDPNGTIQGAFIGPNLDGSLVDSLSGFIGTDGGRIENGNLIDATIVGDADVDIFRFEVLSPGQVTIELNSNPFILDDFDTYLRLFNDSGQEIAFNDDIQTGNLFSSITAALEPGVYFAGVSGFNNANYDPTVAASGTPGSTGSYSIQFSLSNADPNGLISGAVPIIFSNDQEPVIQGGTIGFDYGIPVGVSDVDLFEVRVPDDGTLFIDIDTPFNTNFVDSYLRIFDENGNELVASDDDLAVDIAGFPNEFTNPLFPGLVFENPNDFSFFNGHTTDSFVSGTVERGDVYYIGVSDFFNQAYNPNTLGNRPQVGEGGFYNLFVTFINNDQNGSIPQALDNSIIPLPVTGQPGTIGLDTDFQTGQVFDVGDRDVDFVRINSATAGILEIDIDAYSESSIVNPVDAVALIFDAQGNLLALNDDSNGSLDPLLRYQVAANTDYFVAITGFGNENFDPFQLGSGTPGDTGEYIFNSRLLPLSQAAQFSDDIIGNGAVQDIVLGSVIPGEIGEDDGLIRGAADIDLYRFRPTESGIVDIQVQAFEAFSADTFLRIFDQSGNEIAFNDDANALTLGSSLSISVTAGSTYYIGINGYSPEARNYDPLTGAGAAPGSQGSYTLIIDELFVF